MINICAQRGKQLAHLAVLFSLMVFAGTTALAQAPAAGTSIGNQASAIYTDASSIQRTATSNLVTTTVAQVGAFTLTSPNNKTGAPGSQVVYSHILTNTGNGTDTFNLTAPTSGTFVMGSVGIYADANGDGIPDNLTALTSVTLASGAISQFVIIGTVPIAATSGQTGVITLTSKATFDPSLPAQTNADTTTVTNNAIVNVTKAISSPSGPSPSGSSGPYTVTLTYTNNGGTAASAVTLIDALPAGMTYVAGSGHWSVTGATALTDLTGDSQPSSGSPQIDYSITSNTVKAIITTVPTTVSGTLTFQVTIDSGLAPKVLSNTATVGYNDGSIVVPTSNTNTATFTVRQSAALTISAGTTVASAAQGASVSFTSLVTNTGNGSDIFNITLSGSTFPIGTTFNLLRTDGVTPLTDSNNDGISDSGPLAAATAVNIVVQAVLPPGTSGVGPYTLKVTATSTVVGAINAGASAFATDTLTAITANAVDLTNNTTGSGAPGFGAGPEGSAVITNANVLPGTTTTFTLYAANTAGTADSYDLLASQTTPFPGSLPSGWSVQFRSSTGADCSLANMGASIANTGVVNAGTNKLVCAVLSVPMSYAAGTVQIYFQALSATTGAKDQLHDSVTVSTVHNITLTPNNSGQVNPGGSVNYNHALTNNGNVAETITFVAGWVADGTAGFASVFYQDNGSVPNSLDATDSPVTAATTFTLAPGASVVMLTKVTAPSGAAVGAVDTTTLTATYNGGTSTAVATDSSTVITGQLRLTKLQVLDASCTGVPGAFAASPITVGAKPNACVIYQITAVNQGTSAITGVVVDDAPPANTTYTASGTHPAATSRGSIAPPAEGGTASVITTVGTMQPNDTAVITFSVKINH